MDFNRTSYTIVMHRKWTIWCHPTSSSQPAFLSRLAIHFILFNFNFNFSSIKMRIMHAMCKGSGEMIKIDQFKCIKNGILMSYSYLSVFIILWWCYLMWQIAMEVRKRRLKCQKRRKWIRNAESDAVKSMENDSIFNDANWNNQQISWSPSHKKASVVHLNALFECQKMECNNKSTHRKKAIRMNEWMKEVYNMRVCLCVRVFG